MEDEYATKFKNHNYISAQKRRKLSSSVDSSQTFVPEIFF
jgi:hypothetical protein